MMPKFLVKWKLNHHTFPTDPEEQGKVVTSLFQMVKDDVAAGVCLDWAMFPEVNQGISFSNENEEELSAILMKYYPYILHEVKPLVSLDQAMRAFQKSVETMKK